MPSLFSRSRATSTPRKPSFLSLDQSQTPLGSLDEFGRVASRSSQNTPSKKDKKRAKELDKRNKTISSTREYNNDHDQQPEPSPFPDGTFLPLNLEPPKNDSNAGEQSKEHDYGYLSYGRHAVLGLEQASRLVDVVSDQLETRGGITTPFIFSTTALDISSSAIKRLIRAFLNTCVVNAGHAANEAERKWREEAQFAGPHELGMCLRWGLARIIRSVGGQDVRGLVSWEHYVEFRDSEAAHGYPSNHFETFLAELVAPLQSIIVRLLSLLARLTANSASSGHTPPTLSPLFGPLLFGLGPATLTFHHAYIHYLRAVHAMEHILLSFIRWQDTPKVATGSASLYTSGSAAALGVPTRLKEWIKGYPAMLPFVQQGQLKKSTRPEIRKGARTVRVMSVRRNVRMYSPDLVKTASAWAHHTNGPVGSQSNNALATSKEWDRIAPASLKLPPRYSESYKKRMNMPPNFHPAFAHNGNGAAGAMSLSASTSSTMSSSSAGSSSDYFGLGGREGEDRFRSLTDLKWGEFESMGFGGLGDQKKLEFDLTESARTERSAKRATLSWNDFSSSGFTRTDPSLSATLQFSTPIAKNISSWPSQNAEITRKLKKSQKALPAFGWDTEPVIGSEEVIEEAFLDVFCDLVYGGGWMDLERGEELDRDCNWALVEYKSLPPSRTTAAGGSDPRTATTLVLFEEFVPLEYRQQLAVKSSSRRRLPSLFSPSSKAKPWKQAATLNGRPYVVGHVPHSPSYREVEFEGLLRGGNATKVISLGTKGSNPPQRPDTGHSQTSVHAPQAISAPLHITEPEPSSTIAQSDDHHSDSTTTPSSKRLSRFKLPGGIPVPGPGGMRKTGGGMVPSEVEFVTRMASYSDDEYVDGVPEEESVKQKRRESKDDAWVDILVGTQARRMGGQDAELGGGKRGLRGRRSDPELASLEVAQVLAAVQNRSPSPPSITDRVDRDYGMDHHVADLDVDEIETVPRTSEARTNVTDDAEELEVATLPYRENGEDSGLDDEIDDDEEAAGGSPASRLLAQQQRRPGYFDLHPDRRPVVKQQPPPVVDDDPRLLLAADDSADEDEEIPAQSGPVRRLPIPPKESTPLPAPPPEDLSPVTPPTPEKTIPKLVPAVSKPAPIAPVAAIAPAAVVKKPEPERIQPPLPAPASNGRSISPVTAPAVDRTPSPLAQSKTAALIEMYREREKGVSPQPAAPSPVVPTVIAPLPPSRLPVRSASLPKEPVAPQPSVLAPQTLTPSPKTSPKPSPKPSPVEGAPAEPPQVPFIDPGRASPARYIHGAPLHNVLEEEEEE